MSAYKYTDDIVIDKAEIIAFFISPSDRSTLVLETRGGKTINLYFETSEKCKTAFTNLKNECKSG